MKQTAAPVPAERTVLGSASLVGGGGHPNDSSAAHQQRPENALDALLDELQTFSRPTSQMSEASGCLEIDRHAPNMLEVGRSASQTVQPSGRAPNISDIGRKSSVDSSTSLAIVPPGQNSLRRLHSYPSSSDTDTSPPIARLQVSDGVNQTTPKPPLPERNAQLLQLATTRRVPPPPPPRTSSRSPLASPTSPQLPPRNPAGGTLRRAGKVNGKDTGKPPMALPNNGPQNGSKGPEEVPNNIVSTSNSSSCESINSQEGMQNKKHQEQLEQRHQELLRKQKALQEQYARLQQLQRNASGVATVPPAPPDLLKKTGSESNLLAKMGLGLSTTTSGSLSSLAAAKMTISQQQPNNITQVQNSNNIQATTSKIYETDIL